MLYLDFPNINMMILGVLMIRAGFAEYFEPLFEVFDSLKIKYDEQCFVNNPSVNYVIQNIFYCKQNSYYEVIYCLENFGRYAELSLYDVNPCIEEQSRYLLKDLIGNLKKAECVAFYALKNYLAHINNKLFKKFFKNEKIEYYESLKESLEDFIYFDNECSHRTSKIGNVLFEAFFTVDSAKVVKILKILGDYHFNKKNSILNQSQIPEVSKKPERNLIEKKDFKKNSQKFEKSQNSEKPKSNKNSNANV